MSHAGWGVLGSGALLGLVLALSACGGAGQDLDRQRTRNPNVPRTDTGGTGTMPTAPRDMPGGGRSSDPPKFKGKP